MFTLDGIADGPGGADDFQKFTLPDTFRGLDHIYFDAEDCGTSGCDFAIDNFADSPAPVPEPGVLGMFGFGLLGLGLAIRRRKHHK